MKSVLARGFGGGGAVGFVLGTESAGIGCRVEVAGLMVVVLVALLVLLALEEADVVGAALGGGGEGFVGVLELSWGASQSVWM